MSESKFKILQKEVCDPALEPPPLKKLCAPCTPNQNYIEPDWEFVEIATPYLNEKQCEYQITVTVNKYGDSFTAKEFRELRGAQENFGSREALLRSFIHPSIVLILEEYGKLVADQIICATFPGIPGDPLEIIPEIDSFEGAFIKLMQQEPDRNRIRCEDFGTYKLKGIDPTEEFDFQRNLIEMGSNKEIQNPFALELYTIVKDFYIDPIENILKVHIGIPAFIIDQVPNLPSKSELEKEAMETKKSVSIKVEKLFGQIKRLEFGLTSFGKYQSYFYQSQNGFLKYKESNKDFYATKQSTKVGQFYADLKVLGDKNDINLKSNIPSLVKLNADNVRIEFEQNGDNPYHIKAIYAWKEGCSEKELKKGFPAFQKKYSKITSQSLMNYIAKINEIDLTLQARQTTPWLDFLVKYTYPLIIVDYGLLNMQSVGDTLGKCVEENAREFGGQLRDYILNEALSFMNSLSYQYSSAASCEELFSTENQPESKEFQSDYGLGEGIDARKKVKEQQEKVDLEEDFLPAKTQELNERIDIMRQERQEKSSKLDGLSAELDEIEANIESGISTNKELREAKTKYKDLSKEIENIDTRLLEINDQLKKLPDNYKKVARKQFREDRKNAAKKARKNAKSHPYAKKAYKIAMEQMKKSDTLLASLIDWEKYEKEGKLSRKKFERDKSKSFVKDVLARLNICTAKAITVNAIRCLFSGVTKERAFDKIFKAALQAMDIDVFGFFIGGLPPAAQTELREKFKKEFGDIPLPWEEEYESGGGSKNQYKGYLSSKNAKERDDEQKRQTLVADNKSKLEQLQSDYDASLDAKAKLMVDQEDALKNFNEAESRKAAFDAAPPDPRLPPETYENAKLDLARQVVNTTIILTDITTRLEEISNKPADLLISINELKESIAELDEQKPDEVKDFKSLSDEEKIERIREQKKAQGTFGAALGNIQQEVVDAYIEFLFDVLNIDEIGDALSSVPGGTLVFNTLDEIFKCSSQGLFDPPLKSFLSSLSLDVCGEDKHIGIAIPERLKTLDDLKPNFSKAFFIQKLKAAFITKMETVITKVIVMLLLKLFETVDNALCKSLNAVGQAVIGTLTGGSSASMSEAFADAFCPDADENELNQVQKNLFGNALGKGAAPDSAYDCLFRAINGTMSKREIIDLLTNTPSNMDDATANKFALLVNSRCPELSDLLGDPEDVKDAFGSMGKYIPPELKDYLQEQNANDLDAPIYDAICLTQDELDLWNANRKQLYLGNGLDEETADDLINKANERALDNLGSLADILQKGPDGLLGEALDALLTQPECPTDPGAIVTEDELLAEEKNDLMNDFFKRIESRFLRDLLGERNSLLGNILIDKQGNRLEQHNRRVNIGDRTILYANYVDSEEQWDERKEEGGFIKRKFVMDDEEKARGMFPDTVGMHMLNQLTQTIPSYKTSKDKPQIKLEFSSRRDEVLFDIEHQSTLNYKLNHNKQSTQRIFITEKDTTKTLGMDFNEGPENTLNARRNQVFDYTEGWFVNYEIEPNEIPMFAQLLQQKSNSSKLPKKSKLISLFDKLNSKALVTIQNNILQTPDGGIPPGFNYGYEDGQSITFKDLLYVDPDSDPNDESTWKYSFREKDAVLGKSATGNPRVHFLDPAVHGGRYKYPKIYIEPGSYSGWLGALKTFIPQVQTCEDKDNGFLNMTEVSRRAKKVENNLPVDARLKEALECRLEVPYDRQLMPANHGLIEGIIISTIRAYATEFMLRGFPIFGSIQFNEHNFDSLISNALADHMEREMSEAGVFSNISRLAYYLVFLEQSVQVVQRQIIDGLMEETEEMKKASKVINKAQNNFEKLKFIDFISDTHSDQIKKEITNGSKIIAFGNQWTSPKYKDLQSIRGLTPYKINLARKLFIINETKAEAKVFLSALVAKEVAILSKKLSLDLRPRPHIYNIQKYMLSTNGIMAKSDIKAGFSSVEQEVIEGGNQPDYGSIIDCAGPDLQNPLGTIDVTAETFNNIGAMYLEKYVRVINKDSTEQVMKVSEFQRMISDRSVYDEEMPLSEYFGDAQIIANKLTGTIGVKFGVRLMMCLNKHMGLEPNLDLAKERLPSLVTTTESTIQAICFPIASYELDIIDDKIKDIDIEDPNMGEDIKCYVDQLCETKEYKLLFDKIIKTRSFCSIYGIYSFENFIESIGQIEVEDENRRRKINQAWKEKIFDDTKRILRKQLRSVYNSQDDTRSSRLSGLRTSNINFLKNLIPEIYLNIQGVGFLQRLRIVDANPFDEDGKPCVNEFQKLFEE